VRQTISTSNKCDFGVFVKIVIDSDEWRVRQANLEHNHLLLLSRVVDGQHLPASVAGLFKSETALAMGGNRSKELRKMLSNQSAFAVEWHKQFPGEPLLLEPLSEAGIEVVFRWRRWAVVANEPIAGVWDLIAAALPSRRGRDVRAAIKLLFGFLAVGSKQKRPWTTLTTISIHNFFDRFTDVQNGMLPRIREPPEIVGEEVQFPEEEMATDDLWAHEEEEEDLEVEGVPENRSPIRIDRYRDTGSIASIGLPHR
jgi:hypothetical protein